MSAAAGPPCAKKARLEAGECPVCREAYTADRRRVVRCGHCDTACCSQCLRQYLLTLQSDPQCMTCKAAMNGEFLAMHLPSTWLRGEYKQHRERVLQERQVALLPQSQDMVTNYREAQRLLSRSETLRAEANRVAARAAALNRDADRAFVRADAMRRRHYLGPPDGADDDTASSSADRRQFVRACPVADCRGFLSTAWKCGTCDVRVCKDCGEPKTGGAAGADDGGAAGADGHVCDPEVAAGHAAMLRQSKPCPQCGARISKIDGCDQMWCTQCHVAFGWRTGAVITRGAFHNPHYVEWQRRNGGGRNGGAMPREPGDVPCGGLPTPFQLDRALDRRDTATSSSLRNANRLASHVQDVDVSRMRRLVGRDVDPMVQDADLRLSYLLGRIDEQRWRVLLQRREKKRDVTNEVLQVFEMFVATAVDVFRALTSGAQSPADALAELRRLRDYGNACLDKIDKRFGMRVQKLPTAF